MGSKMLSLRDNRLKCSTSKRRNRVEFFDETYKNKKELYRLFDKKTPQPITFLFIMRFQ
jgi:hypothetical protein